MPVELNTLFAQAQALPDERQFHVDNGGDLAEGSGLHGLSPAFEIGAPCGKPACGHGLHAVARGQSGLCGAP